MTGDPLDLDVDDAILEALHRPHEYVPLNLYDEVTKLAELALRDLLSERRKLVEVAKAASARRVHEHNRPILLDDQTYESWAREDRALGAAEDAALARLGGAADGTTRGILTVDVEGNVISSTVEDADG